MKEVFILWFWCRLNNAKDDGAPAAINAALILSAKNVKQN